MAFGFETAWFAVHGSDTESVRAALGVRTAVPSGWSSALPAVESEGIFVSPPIDGWVFAVGCDAFMRGDCARIEEALLRLGEACGPAFWFATHARRDVHGWACSNGRQLVRAYLYEGSKPCILWDEGMRTPAEIELDFFVEDPRDLSDDDIKWWPTPADVVALAGRWTVDPCHLAGRGEPGRGLLGRL